MSYVCAQNVFCTLQYTREEDVAPYPTMHTVGLGNASPPVRGQLANMTIGSISIEGL